MVHDNETFPPVVLPTSRGIGGQTPVQGPDYSYPSGSRHQYGFRSGPLSEDEQAEIQNLSDHGKWKDIPTMLQALEKLETAASPSPYIRGSEAPVNERDYESFSSTPMPFSFTYKESWYPKVLREATGGLVIKAIEPLGFDPDGYYRGKAAAILRDIAPTNADLSLARMAGELRQWKDLLGVPKLSSPGYAGKVDLQYEFGIKPTLSDLRALMKSVERMDSHFKQFVRDSGSLVRRSREVILEEDTFRSVSEPSLNYGMVTFNVGPVQISRAHYDGYYYRSENAWDVYCNRRIVLRPFATFQYFASARKGFGSSASSFLDKARYALGGGLTASTAYQLTPYSWLLDWFVDFGSLLEFQEGVADYSTVMSRCGFVVEEQQVASVAAVAAKNTTSYPSHTATGTARAFGKLQRRRRGSPYSLNPNWPTDPGQLRILTSLGLSFLPG